MDSLGVLAHAKAHRNCPGHEPSRGSWPRPSSKPTSGLERPAGLESRDWLVRTPPVDMTFWAKMGSAAPPWASIHDPPQRITPARHPDFIGLRRGTCFAR
jgi:hypothetical protein